MQSLLSDTEKFGSFIDKWKSLWPENPAIERTTQGNRFWGITSAAAYHWSVLMHGPAWCTCTENINT